MIIKITKIHLLVFTALTLLVSSPSSMANNQPPSDLPHQNSYHKEISTSDFKNTNSPLQSYSQGSELASCSDHLTLSNIKFGIKKPIQNYNPIDYLDAIVKTFDIPNSYLFETLIIYTLESNEIFNMSLEDFFAWSALNYGTSFSIEKINNPFNLVPKMTRNLLPLISNEPVMHNSLSTIYLKSMNSSFGDKKLNDKIRAQLDEYLLAKLDKEFHNVVIQGLFLTLNRLCYSFFDLPGSKDKSQLKYFLNMMDMSTKTQVCNSTRVLLEDENKNFHSQKQEISKLLGRLIETLAISLKVSDPNYKDHLGLPESLPSKKPSIISTMILQKIDEIRADYELKSTVQASLNKQDVSSDAVYTADRIDLNLSTDTPSLRSNLSSLQRQSTLLSHSLSKITTIHFTTLDTQRNKIESFLKAISNTHHYLPTDTEINDLTNLVESREKTLIDLNTALNKVELQANSIQDSLNTVKNELILSEQAFINASEVIAAILKSIEGLRLNIASHQKFNDDLLTTTSKLMLEGKL